MEWIQTFSGVKFDLESPRAEDVRLEDIASHLSNLCRFSGATATMGAFATPTSTFYSVAQHAVAVSRILPPHLALAGLLHDAGETYTNDITRPMKAVLKKNWPGFQAFLDAIDAAIGEKFGIDWRLFHHPDVCGADQVLLATERRDLMVPGPLHDFPLPAARPQKIVPFRPELAREMFLLRYEELVE